MIRLTVYGQPAPAGSKTTGVSNAGRRFVRESSKAAGPWKRAVAQAAGEAMDGRALLEGPLMLSLVFYLPRPTGHYGKKGLRPSAPRWPVTRPDVLKLARAVEDACTGILWRDDAQIVEEILRKNYGAPVRCEITVTRLGTSGTHVVPNLLGERPGAFPRTHGVFGPASSTQQEEGGPRGGQSTGPDVAV